MPQALHFARRWSVAFRLPIFLLFVSAITIAATRVEAGPLFEAGRFDLPDTIGQTGPIMEPVTFRQSYDVEPLVFVVPTNQGSDPAALRVNNVTKDGFDVIHAEPSNLDGERGPMTDLAYFAVVPGKWEIEPGVFLEAGSVLTDTTVRSSAVFGSGGGWDTVPLETTFGAAPAIQTTIQTMNSEQVATVPIGGSVPWLTAGTRNIAAGSFQLALERAEVDDGGTVVPEKIGYVAMTQAADTFDGDFGGGGGYTVDDGAGGSVPFDAFISADNIHGWEPSGGAGQAQPFSQSFSTAPLVVASIARRDGGDGGWIRRGEVTASQVKLAVDEDTFNDSEREHTTEAASVLAVEREFHAFVPAQEVFWDGGTDDVDGVVRPDPDDGSTPYPVQYWRDNTGWRHDNGPQNSPPNNVLPSALDVVNIALEDNAVPAPVEIEDGDDFEVDSIRLGINPGLGVGGHGRLNITGGELRVYEHAEPTASVVAGSQPGRGTLNAGYNPRTGYVTVSGGLLDVENALNLGVESGGVGQLTVSGGAVQAGELNVGVGDGTGNVAQSGGSVTVNGDLNFGKNGTQGGTYHLTGGSLSVTGQVLEWDEGVGSAQLYVDVDADADPSAFSVGGDITVQSFRLGQNAAATGRWTLPDGKRIVNTGALLIGSNGTGELTVDDSTGTVADPTIRIDNSLRIGAGDSGNSGDGTLNFRRGIIGVSGGANVAGHALSNRDATTGHVEVGYGGGSLDETQLIVASGNLEVGRAGTGTLIQHSGTVSLNRNLVIGQEADANGTYEMRGGLLTLSSGSQRNINFNSGTGLLEQTGGVVELHGGDVNMTNATTGDATYRISGGELRAADGMSMDINLNEGTARFEQSGGTVRTRGGNIAFEKTTSSMELSGGTMNLGGGRIEVQRADGTQFAFSGGRLEGLGEFRAPALAVPDASGNGHLGAAFNVDPADNVVVGKVGSSALYLDDTNNAKDNEQYVAVDLAFRGANTLAAVSAAAWFNTSADDGGYNQNWALLDFDRSDFFDVFVQPDDGKIGFSTASSGSGIDDMVSTTGGLNDGQWHHVAVIYDGTDKHIYIDGSLDATVSAPHGGLGLGVGNTRYGLIGEGSEAASFDGGGNNLYYDGSIDELAVWTGALDETDVAALYAAGAGASAGSVASGDLLLHMPMDDFPRPALVQTGGVLAPGDPIGTTTILADYDMVGGELEIGINGYDQGDAGSADGVGYDFVDVEGLATLNGSLSVEFLDGFLPEFLDTFDVLQASEGITLDAGFELVEPDNWLPEPFRLGYSILDLGGGAELLQLRVETPEPGSLGLALLGLLCCLTIRRRASH